jgi:adenylate kinase
VLDGFPRTIPQADWLTDQAKAGRFSVDCIINLIASEDVVVKRLTSRGRPDDTREAIARRIEEYEAVTQPILQHFRAENIPVHDIDGDRDARVIHDDILELIDNPEKLV